MSILEDLWFGNIALSDRHIGSDSDYRRALRKVGEERERLLSGQPQEIQAALDRLFHAESEFEIVAERDAFLLGFRLAVQLLIDGMKNC